VSLSRELGSVLQRLRPLRFIKFALQGDHTLEHVSATIDAVMVGHRDLEVGKGVFSSKGVKAQRHRGASGKRHAQEFVGVDTALAPTANSDVPTRALNH
jgi:hypothetical protein